jgi:hypothetical protein
MALTTGTAGEGHWNSDAACSSTKSVQFWDRLRLQIADCRLQNDSGPIFNLRSAI